ncbi:MAG: cupin domain-containing protein [Ruminococcus sp.]|nr:cupin domain-containing protein [Ruminococcus sp.]
MVFDLTNETAQKLPHFKGGEKYLLAKMHEDSQNRFLHGTLVPGATIGEHCHEQDSEIIYILEGEGVVLFDGKLTPVCAGQCHYCPNGHTHSLMNHSDKNLVFFAVIPKSAD